MNFFSYISESLGTLLQNKMRSFLSLLGIVIGVSSVVIITAIGDGMTAELLKSMTSTQNIITVAPGPVSSYGGSPFGMMLGGGAQQTDDRNENINIEQKIAAEKIFTLEVVEDIQKIFKNSVKAVIPVMSFRANGAKIYKGKQIYGDVSVINKSYISAKDLKANRGILFTDEQFKNAEKVVVLGFNVIDGLVRSENSSNSNTFNKGKKDPVGQKIFINDTAFTIIGILEKTDDGSIDYNMFVPYTTVEENFEKPKIEKLEVIAKNIDEMSEIQKNLGYYLMKITGAESPATIQFHLKTQEALIKELQKSMQTMSLFVSGIAAISLFVGGIGIMNIMLVSVTERTREIGIRKAIGARRSDIIFQFLIESALLSLLGGIFAIIFSYFIVIILPMISDFKPIISVTMIIIATVFSIFMGIVFGLIPASKAAKMDAIEALRFE